MGLDIHIIRHPAGEQEIALYRKAQQLQERIDADCMNMEPLHAAGVPYHKWPTSVRDAFMANRRQHKYAKAITALEYRVDDITPEWEPEQNAPGYEGHSCGLNYFRSAYNDSGFNRRCDHYLAEPYSGGFYYIFGYKDEGTFLFRPDWEETKKRALEVRKAWEETREQFNGHTVEEIVLYWNSPDQIDSPRAALIHYLTQDYENALRGGYTKSGAVILPVHGEGKIRAIYAGQKTICGGVLPDTHSVYVVWDHEGRDHSHIDYCVDVCTIVVKACSHILDMPEHDRKNMWVYWSA